MKATSILGTFVVLGLLCAGCESSTNTPAERQSVAKGEPEKAPTPNTATSNPSTKGVWPNKPRNGDTTENNTTTSSDNQPNTKDRIEVEEEPPPEKDPPIPESWKALNTEKTLYFEKTATGQRRIHLVTKVCLREGQLEVLVCKLETKEHEAILHVDVDARDIHTALIAAGAKPGTTVKFVPDYKPATGDIIRVKLTYYKDGKLQTEKPAQSWIQHARTMKDMEHDWVFAGSRLFKFPDEPNKPPYYCANNGEIISIANFPDSMLDLPVKSSKEAAELGYVANKERIPPLKTKVIVTLEVLKKG